MDKAEFCYRMQEAFNSLRERNLENVIVEYETVLTGDIDYKELFNLLMSEWDKNYRPMPHDLKSFVNRAKIRQQQNVSDDVKEDLFKVVRWFNGNDYQREHKPIPDYIRFTINQHKFSDELMNNTMTSDEFRKWLNDIEEKEFQQRNK